MIQWIQMELENNNFAFAEQVLTDNLMTVPNVGLWSAYMNYIRRMNDLTNDATGNARTTVEQAYDFVLNNVGIDRESGRLWQEYIDFLKNTPGQIGAPGWLNEAKSDKLRKAYHRAIATPMTTVNALWKDYDQLENTINKATVSTTHLTFLQSTNSSKARKFVQEHSAAYMTARSANTAFDNITRGLVRTTLPRLPPAHGFQGDDEYMQQVELWKKWISWEKDEDPLALQDTEKAAFKQRVLYVYKQAVIALRFWPEIWVEAAEWCYANDMATDGDTFLNNGVAANPESCLVAFKKADRLETTLPTEEADKDLAEKGRIVRAPYDRLLEVLYGLHKQLKHRELQDLAKLEASSEVDDKISAILSKAEDDDEENEAEKKLREVTKASQVKAIQQGYVAQAQLLQRTISFTWIALMRAMRRVQGKGAVKDPVGGSRQIFADARVKGKITSDVYVASALIEHHVYKDPAGTKIFERGAKLFPEDEGFILEYLKHLLSIGDTTSTSR
jgi:cleavage stimulation factor subunit 3